jgi:small redox-active disulfide protein 2
MKIEILGTGCPKCKKLTQNVEEAVKELDLDVEIFKVTDINDIMSYDVIMTPGLVIDGVVKSSGKILGIEDIKKILLLE